MHRMQNVPGEFFNVLIPRPIPGSRCWASQHLTRNTRAPCLMSGPSCEPSLDIVNEYLAGGNRVKIWSSEIKYTCYVIDTQDSPCIFNCVTLSMSIWAALIHIHCVTINTSLRHPALLWVRSERSRSQSRALREKVKTLSCIRGLRREWERIEWEAIRDNSGNI